MPTNVLSPSDNAQLAELLAELEANYGPRNALMPDISGAALARTARGPRTPILMPGSTAPSTGAELLPTPAPTMRDRIARFVLGDRPDEARMGVTDVLLGSRGMGPSGPSVAGIRPSDFLPIGPAADYVDASAAGNTGDALLSGIGAVGAGAPRVAGRAISGAVDALGAAARGVGRGASAVGRGIAARPVTSTAAAATTAAATPSAAESPTVGPTTAEHGTPIPAPPTLPPSLDAYIDRALSAARSDIDKRNDQQRRVSEETGRRFRPESLAPKREAEIRARAEADYGRLSESYKTDMANWETERKRIIAEDRKSYNDKSFAERNPTAAGLMTAGGYIAPPLLAASIWKGRYKQGQQILDDVYKAGSEAAPGLWNSLMGRAPAAPAASAMERGDVSKIADSVARAQEWSNPVNVLARGAMTVPVGLLPAESRMAMDYWDRATMPPDSAAYQRGKENTTWDLPKAGNFLMQSIPGWIGVAGGMKMAGTSPGSDLRALQRYGLDASDPRSIAALRERVSSNVAAGRSAAGTGSADIGPSGGPQTPGATSHTPRPHPSSPDPDPPPSPVPSPSPSPAPIGGGRPSSGTTDNIPSTPRPSPAPRDKATADAPRWDKLIAASESGTPLAEARAGLNANQIARLEAAIRADPRSRPATVLKRLRSQGFPLAVGGAVAAGSVTHHSHNQSRDDGGRFVAGDRHNVLMPE